MAEDVFGGMDARRRAPRLARRRAPRGARTCSSREPSEFAGRAVGPHLGLPTAIVAITQYAVERHLEAHVDAALRRLRDEYGFAAPTAPARRASR